MSTKIGIAIAALITMLASPALAGDQDLANSGRYVPELTVQSDIYAQSGAYASAAKPARTHVNAPKARIEDSAIEFQAQGQK